MKIIKFIVAIPTLFICGFAGYSDLIFCSNTYKKRWPSRGAIWAINSLLIKY